MIVICSYWKGSKFLQLSYYNSSRLSEDLDALSSSVAEFLCDSTHAIFISFSFSHLRKENKQYICFFLCAFQVYLCWFLPFALAMTKLHSFWVDITPQLGPFRWQWCPPYSPFLCYRGRNLHGCWSQERKVMWWSGSRDTRKPLQSIRRNEEGCSDLCSMDRQVGKSVPVPATELVTEDQRWSIGLEFQQEHLFSWNKARPMSSMCKIQGIIGNRAEQVCTRSSRPLLSHTLNRCLSNFFLDLWWLRWPTLFQHPDALVLN